MKHKTSWYIFIAFTLIFLCFAVIGVGVFGYNKLYGRISVLENPELQAQLSDAQLIIDFLRDQMQLLIWILGVIVAIAGAVLAFLGLHTQKSVEEQYEMKYNKLMAAENEKAFKKQIVFLYKDNSDTIIGFRNEIRNRQYNTELYQASDSGIISKLSSASIVIYCVNSADDPLYKDIVDWCESAKTHCILYCPNVSLPPDYIKLSRTYMSTSIQIAKLRESLYTLLYLAP